MTATTNFKSGYCIVNGISMYYESHGDGLKVLVLVHGGGSTINTTFDNILPLLAKSFKVIALELQAHGRTSDRDSPESFEQDADDVIALLTNLGISKASFLGFSNGGNTVIQIANRAPAIVDKLILASTFYKREGFLPGFFEGMKQATLDHMPESLRNAFLQVNPDPAGLLNMFNKDKQRMLEFKDWNDEMLSNIEASTLIISGDQDVIVPEHAVAMARLISNSRLLILPATHGEYMGVAESPVPSNVMLELTAQIIREFLNGQ